MAHCARSNLALEEFWPMSKRTILAATFPRHIAVGDSNKLERRFARDMGEETPWEVEELQPGRLRLRSMPREGRRDLAIEFEYVGFGYSLTYAPAPAATPPAPEAPKKKLAAKPVEDPFA
jgi:hypothetical protein